jgi:glycosyltransferase involved in cell wall biosynthesis
MSARFGVAIGTYGERDLWAPLVQRAIASVKAQSQECIYSWHHCRQLHQARNDAANQLIDRGVDWLVFLDADDELHPDFIMNMALYASVQPEGEMTVLQPSSLGVVDGVEDNFPYLKPQTNLLQENYLIIGCAHPAKLFQSIGGFDDWPLLEDWAYWTKAWVHGASFEQVPDAVYRVHIDRTRVSRNQSASTQVTSETFTKIRAMYSLLAKKAGLV